MYKCKEEREIKERLMRLIEMNDENEEKLEVLRKQLNELRGLYKKELEHYIGKYIRYGGICMKVGDVCVINTSIDLCSVIFYGCGMIEPEGNELSEGCVKISNHIEFTVSPERSGENSQVVYNLENRVKEITKDEYMCSLIQIFNRIRNNE